MLRNKAVEVSKVDEEATRAGSDAASGRARRHCSPTVRNCRRQEGERGAMPRWLLGGRRGVLGSGGLDGTPVHQGIAGGLADELVTLVEGAVLEGHDPRVGPGS